MHADEVDIDAFLVRRLVGGSFPQWADLPVKPVESSGTENAMYRLGDDLAVRLPRIGRAARAMETERAWLPRLAPRLPVAVPAPLAAGEPAHGYPWSWTVLPWLDGDNPVVGRLSRPRALATDLAGFLGALRRIDTTGAPSASRGVPLAQRDAPTRAAIADLHGIMEPEDTVAAGAVWAESLRVPAWSCPPVWVHGDLSPGNILTAEGRLGAVIDFGAIGVGDPAVDLIVAWNLLPAVVRDDFRAEAEIDDDTWARGRGWALSIALIQLPYYRRTNPALAANARHVIGEVLADHR